MLKNNIPFCQFSDIAIINPVIVLEGSRTVSAETGKILSAMGKYVAQLFPKATFRSGNADGADSYFINGVLEANAKQSIELMIPYRGHKKKNIPAGARVLALDELNETDLEYLKNITIQANAKTKAMISNFNMAAKGYAVESAKYLLRDGLKIIGNTTHEYAPATFALFYVKPNATKPGGTEHTMKVADYCKIPYQTQSAWAFAVPKDIYTENEKLQMEEIGQEILNITGQASFIESSEDQKMLHNEYNLYSQVLLSVLMRY